MRKSTLLAAAFAAFASPAPLMAQAPGQDSAVYDASCDRECLIGAVRAYVDALRKRDPGAVPAAEGLTFTENNVVLPLGKGLWGTVTDVDRTGLEVADTQTRNAAWFGSVREKGEPAIFAVRIHVTNGKIDQVESVVHRKGALPAPFGDVTKMVHDPAFAEVLPPEKRRPRERLRAIADSYFDTVELNDGQVFAPFSDDCGRLENGISTTSNLNQRPGGNAAGIAEGCEAQFKLGIYRINKRVRERQYPIIDEERGVVVATGFFDHANEWDRYKLTDGREMKTALKWPNSITLLEAFQITDAQIHRIEAVFTYVPYFMHNPFAGPGSTAPQYKIDPTSCDAACLTGLARQVMGAYVSKDWKTLPWADKVGNAENSVGIQVGEGNWGSITAVDAKPLIVADPSTGKAVWIGRIEEHGQPAWGAFTVSGAGGKITAIDALVRRKEYGPPYAEPTAAPSFPVLPAKSRTARAEMLSGVEGFYQAIARQDGRAPAGLAKNCQWAVNGVTLSPCPAPFTGRLLQSLEQIRDRKVLAVDEERGLVAVSTFEDFPATGQDAQTYPRTQQVVELFRFNKGQIERVEAYTAELPYGMKPH